MEDEREVEGFGDTLIRAVMLGSVKDISDLPALSILLQRSAQAKL